MAACPVGAIGADGVLNFSACYTHNYREFMGALYDEGEFADNKKIGEWRMYDAKGKFIKTTNHKSK